MLGLLAEGYVGRPVAPSSVRAPTKFTVVGLLAGDLQLLARIAVEPVGICYDGRSLLNDRTDDLGRRALSRPSLSDLRDAEFVGRGRVKLASA
jgi:hypothetical protein